LLPKRVYRAGGMRSNLRSLATCPLQGAATASYALHRALRRGVESG
jgi:hypothetical protein